MKSKICVVTSSRSEYGLLRNLMNLLEKSRTFDQTVVVTGDHLGGVFTKSIDEIFADNYERVIEVKTSHRVNQLPTVQIVGELISKLSLLLDNIRPDLVLVLGDRYEIFGATAASMLSDVPIAHIHGGEITAGSRDDLHRHAISKMSSLHFVANAEFRNRLINMGEQPSRVFNVGGLGIDSISNLVPISRKQLQNELGITLEPEVALVSYHPDTINPTDTAGQIETLMAALNSYPEIKLIITGANADTGGKEATLRLRHYAENRGRAIFVENLGHTKFLSILSCVDFIIGNSSSGLLEAPAMKIGTINIGNRQAGRPSTNSVVNVNFNKLEIEAGIRLVLSKNFKNFSQDVISPYGEAGASKKILKILEETEFQLLLPKQFHDLQGVKP